MDPGASTSRKPDSATVLARGTTAKSASGISSSRRVAVPASEEELGEGRDRLQHHQVHRRRHAGADGRGPRSPGLPRGVAARTQECVRPAKILAVGLSCARLVTKPVPPPISSGFDIGNQPVAKILIGEGARELTFTRTYLNGEGARELTFTRT